MSADHGSRLDHHEGEIKRLREGQDAIFGELKTLGSGMNNIATKLTELQAAKGPPWHQIIGTASQVVMVIGAFVTGIVYIASNGQSPQQHAIDKRVGQLEWKAERADHDLRRIDGALAWRPTVMRGD